MSADVLCRNNSHPETRDRGFLCPVRTKENTMKKILATTCTSLALLAGVAAFAPATASAATHVAAHASGCVTKSEYEKAKKGMTEKRVAQIFGTNGKRESRASSGGYVSEIRSYRTCSKYSVVVIEFDKNPGGTRRLSIKDAVWVS